MPPLEVRQLWLTEGSLLNGRQTAHKIKSPRRPAGARWLGKARGWLLPSLLFSSFFFHSYGSRTETILVSQGPAPVVAAAAAAAAAPSRCPGRILYRKTGESK